MIIFEFFIFNNYASPENYYSRQKMDCALQLETLLFLVSDWRCFWGLNSPTISISPDCLKSYPWKSNMDNFSNGIQNNKRVWICCKESEAFIIQYTPKKAHRRKLSKLVLICLLSFLFSYCFRSGKGLYVTYNYIFSGIFMNNNKCV